MEKDESEIPLQNRGISGISPCGKVTVLTPTMEKENENWREEGEYY